MKKREDKEQKSKLQIIGAPKEKPKFSLEMAIITSERAGLVFLRG